MVENTFGERIEKLKKLIEKSNRIVFFGGAGVSTESGIPDFRSVDGLYSQKYKYPPETILSHTFFMNNTREFYEFYRNKMICKKAEPNITHKKLAELESEGKLSAIVTQNIDGLHQMAGSRNVYELHGSIHRNYCIKCGKSYTLKYLIDNNMFDKYADGVPRCSSCMEEISRSTGKQMDCVIKPDVVLYEEGLNDETVSSAVYAISNADLLIIGGTSLNVYPAAGLLRYFEGSREKIVLINKTETAFDIQAGTVFHEGLGEVFSRIRTMPLNK